MCTRLLIKEYLNRCVLRGKREREKERVEKELQRVGTIFYFSSVYLSVELLELCWEDYADCLFSSDAAMLSFLH